MLRLLAELGAYFGPLGIFRYVTFRTGGAFATAYYLVLWFGPQIAAVLRLRLTTPHRFRASGPHLGRTQNSAWLTKRALMIVAGVLAGTLLWADLANTYVWAGVVITVGLGAIGVYDDAVRLAAVMICAAVLGVLAYINGNVIFASYHGIGFLSGVGEAAVVCGALIGAGLPVLGRRV